MRILRAAALALALALGGGALCCRAERRPACSSANGPFCLSDAGRFAGVPIAPQHAVADLDRDQETDKRLELAKRVRIERVLKQYELEAAIDDDDDDDAERATRFDHARLLEELDLLLDEAAVLFDMSGEDDAIDGEEESPVVGSFAFTNEGGMFEELDRMNGADLKEFFELALQEVVQSYASTLDDMSPQISQGLHQSMEELKRVSDFTDFRFQVLDESGKAQIRHKFANHRLIEVQQTFEKMVIARTPKERRLALEASVYLFQLAHEAASADSDSAAQSAATEAAPTSASSV